MVLHQGNLIHTTINLLQIFPGLCALHLYRLGWSIACAWIRALCSISHCKNWLTSPWETVSVEMMTYTCTVVSSDHFYRWGKKRTEADVLMRHFLSNFWFIPSGGSAERNEDQDELWSFHSTLHSGCYDCFFQIDRLCKKKAVIITNREWWGKDNHHPLI